jgi:hypothetical protein
MAANRTDISGWFSRGVQAGRQRMIVWCDSFDYEDYPEFTNITGDELRSYTMKENGKNMKRLMEVYDLTADPEPQLQATRAYNY